jgi:hypothetical protein
VVIHIASSGVIKRVPCRSILALLLERADPPSVIVSVVDVAVPFGVNIAGLNVPVDPAGRPEIVNEIGLGNPFAVGVAII